VLVRILDSLRQDVRFALRSIGRARSFAFVAVVVLALGIGASTSVFSVVSNVFVRPLPYPEEERLVVLWQEYISRGWGIVPTSAPNLSALAQQTRTLKDVAGLKFRELSLSDGGRTEIVSGLAVTPNAFGLVGGAAAIGRSINERDGANGATPVAVLSDGLWQRRFGGSADVVGRTVEIDGAPMTVIGVMPPAFVLPPRFRTSLGGTPATVPRVDLWVPLRLDIRPEMAGTRELAVIGRLAPGATLGSAREELRVMASRLLEEYPGNANVGLSFKVLSLREQVFGDVRRPTLLLSAAVLFVVLIACANVAGLLLARATRRHHEFGLRTALGATRGRLVRQALVESVILAIGAGALGMMLAWAGTEILATSISSHIPQVSDPGVDAGVLAFGLALSVAVGVAFGLVPAVHASRPGLYARVVQQRTLPFWPAARRFVLAAEAAMALVLLVGAGLLLRSFLGLVGIDPGFDRAGTVAIGLQIPGRYATDADRRLVYQQIVDRLGALPGVRRVGVTSRLPFSGGGGTSGLVIDGRPAPPPELRPHAAPRVTDSGYFEALGIRLVRGRSFGAPGVDDRVAIVSASAASLFWPQQDPIGQRIRIDGIDSWLTIIGIAEDIRHSGLAVEPEPTVYSPYQLTPVAGVGIVVKGNVPAATLTSQIASEIGQIDPGLPVTMSATFDELVSESLAESRLYTSTVAVFGLFALAVAASGLYGMLSHLVALRRHDIGTRIALGASPAAVIWMVLREGFVPVVSGIAIGLAAVASGAGLLQQQLYEISSRDVRTFMAAPALLLTVALVASYLPARRAARLDPATTLRED
jgi:predicted permease